MAIVAEWHVPIERIGTPYFCKILDERMLLPWLQYLQLRQEPKWHVSIEDQCVFYHTQIDLQYTISHFMWDKRVTILLKKKGDNNMCDTSNNKYIHGMLLWNVTTEMLIYIREIQSILFH